MTKINTLNDLTEEKRNYIEQQYMGGSNHFVGLFATEKEAREAASKEIEKLNLSVGEMVDGKEIEAVWVRVDSQSDATGRFSFEGMSYDEILKACAPYSFYVCSISRRFKNPLSNIAIADSEVNGWTPIQR